MFFSVFLYCSVFFPLQTQPFAFLLPVQNKPKNKNQGPLVGLSVRQAQLNRRFGAEVVAITRHGSEQSPGAFLQDLVLRGGDVLILAVDAAFDAAAHRDLRKEVSDIEAVATDREREYVTGLRITKRGGLAGKTLASAGLLGVNGVRLLAIDRAVGGGTLRFGADGATSSTGGGGAAAEAEQHASAASVVLDGGDVCWFTGGLESISYLIRLPGFDQSQTDQIEKLGVDILERRLVQAAVAADSPIVGRSVREAGFRARYDAVVVGISRKGVALPPDVRDVRLKPGDVLLLDAGRGFARAHANDRAFTLINDVPKSSPIKTGKMWLAIFLLFLMVMSQIIGEFVFFWREEESRRRRNGGGGGEEGKELTSPPPKKKNNNLEKNRRRPHQQEDHQPGAHQPVPRRHPHRRPHAPHALPDRRPGPQGHHDRRLRVHRLCLRRLVGDGGLQRRAGVRQRVRRGLAQDRGHDGARGCHLHGETFWFFLSCAVARRP